MFLTKMFVCCIFIKTYLAGLQKVSDFRSQTGSKPALKQVLSKIGVMEFGH